MKNIDENFLSNDGIDSYIKNMSIYDRVTCLLFVPGGIRNIAARKMVSAEMKSRISDGIESGAENFYSIDAIKKKKVDEILRDIIWGDSCKFYSGDRMDYLCGWGGVGVDSAEACEVLGELAIAIGLKIKEEDVIGITYIEFLTKYCSHP